MRIEGHKSVSKDLLQLLAWPVLLLLLLLIPSSNPHGQVNVFDVRNVTGLDTATHRHLFNLYYISYTMTL